MRRDTSRMRTCSGFVVRGAPMSLQALDYDRELLTVGWVVLWQRWLREPGPLELLTTCVYGYVLSPRSSNSM